MKYKAAYLDKNASPRVVPANEADMYESSLNVLKINNKANDQNNNKGVSVEMIKLPNEAAGVNIHNKAAIRPALYPKAN